MIKSALVGAAAVAALSSAPATAAEFLFSYSGTGISASGTLTTTNTTTTVNGRQAYTITGITGTRNGATINQLFPAGTVVDAVGAVSNLNLYETGPFLDADGFSFGVAGDSPNIAFNVFYISSGYNEFRSNPPVGQGNTELTGFTLARVVPVAPAVPEPATWAMMLIGFGTVGATMRRRKTVASVRFA